MTRSVEEWIGKTDDQTPPPRVRLRVFDAASGRCYLCGRKISAGEYWQCDHVVALANGGANRERNLRPACRNCCFGKTALDVAEKAEVAATRKTHILPKPLSAWGCGRGSKWKKKLNGETVPR
jgi:5-methylcytosine-specific restriction endonuclease McrA